MLSYLYPILTLLSDSTKKSGRRLVGDVHYESAQKLAGAITPVPGGVGPMTVAVLLRNTFENAKKSIDDSVSHMTRRRILV